MGGVQCVPPSLLRRMMFNLGCTLPQYLVMYITFAHAYFLRLAYCKVIALLFCSPHIPHCL